MDIKLLFVVILVMYMGAMWVIGSRGKKYSTTFQSSILAGGQATIWMIIGSRVGTHIGSG